MKIIAKKSGKICLGGQQWNPFPSASNPFPPLSHNQRQILREWKEYGVSKTYCSPHMVKAQYIFISIHSFCGPLAWKLLCVCVPVLYSYKWSHWEFRHQYHSVISRECVINIHVAAVCAFWMWRTRWGERNVTHLLSLDVMMIQVAASVPCTMLFVEGDEWKHIVNQFLNKRENEWDVILFLQTARRNTGKSWGEFCTTNCLRATKGGLARRFGLNSIAQFSVMRQNTGWLASLDVIVKGKKKHNIPKRWWWTNQRGKSKQFKVLQNIAISLKTTIYLR